MNLYRDESSVPKWNAQRNLSGRTHYVDDDTLRFHKSKVLSSHVVDQGLLFAIVTSDAADYENKTREFRYVIFDLFGHVVDRPKLSQGYSSRKIATKRMWEALNKIDAKTLTIEAADRSARQYIEEIASLTKLVQSLENKAA